MTWQKFDEATYSISNWKGRKVVNIYGPERDKESVLLIGLLEGKTHSEALLVGMIASTGNLRAEDFFVVEILFPAQRKDI